MIILKRPTKKPKIVAICGDGRFDRALVRHVAEKLNGYKKNNQNFRKFKKYKNRN